MLWWLLLQPIGASSLWNDSCLVTSSPCKTKCYFSIAKVTMVLKNAVYAFVFKLSIIHRHVTIFRLLAICKTRNMNFGIKICAHVPYYTRKTRKGKEMTVLYNLRYFLTFNILVPKSIFVLLLHCSLFLKTPQIKLFMR